jgi:hypothetical protein
MRLPAIFADRRTGLTGLNAERLGGVEWHTGTHALAHSGPGNVCSGAVVRADSVESGERCCRIGRHSDRRKRTDDAKSIALYPGLRKRPAFSTLP